MAHDCEQQPSIGKSHTLVPPISVLLIESDQVDAASIQDALSSTANGPFHIEWLTRLDDAVARLAIPGVEVVLLDLDLPDGHGIDAFKRIHAAVPKALILVLSGGSDDETAHQALQGGAQDIFPKNRIDAYYWLPRALRYIIDRNAAREALFAEKERAQVTLNSIGDAVLTTDLAGKVSYMNKMAVTMTGWPCEEALGQPLSEVFKVVGGPHRVTEHSTAQRAIDEDAVIGLAIDSVLLRRDGTEAAIEDSAAPIHDREGRVIGAVIVFHDVSLSRAMSARMTHLAQHDFLTGLPNRALLTERLSRAIGQADRHHKRVALLFLDLDNFKKINDSLGHAIGDQLLVSVANRLGSGMRVTDTVSRQGGDEFVVLLAEIEKPEDAAQVADKLIAAFALPHVIDGHELHVTLSIGISLYPDDGSNTDIVLQNADTAMFHAKAIGRNNYQFFRAEMNLRAVQRLAIENGLRQALKLGQFELQYQPKINLESGQMTGAEALIRWHDPANGLIYPDQFISIAEECGLIVPIGRWVLGEACRQVQSWLDQGLDAVPVSINISSVEFRHKDFLDAVAGTLKETSLAPAFLELELTESILMHNAAASATTLKALKDMGVRLAIDDFGTGYSSLSYLRRFPIDTLKIDQSFVRDIASDGDNATIVSAVIGMGRNLQQRVIAEGVETTKQLDLLKEKRCDEGQGFHFSHPLPADSFQKLLEVRHAAPTLNA